METIVDAYYWMNEVRLSMKAVENEMHLKNLRTAYDRAMRLAECAASLRLTLMRVRFETEVPNANAS